MACPYKVFWQGDPPDRPYNSRWLYVGGQCLRALCGKIALSLHRDRITGASKAAGFILDA